MKRYYWSGISNDERIKAIDEITHIVNDYATILNFQRFSDISLNLVLEIEECKLNDLYASLTNILSIEDYAAKTSEKQTDCLLLINITFMKSTGDLEIDVPYFPK